MGSPIRRVESTLEGTAATWLLAAFLVGVSFSPRIPVDLDVGRAVEYRLNELMLIPMAALALVIVIKRPFTMKTPWSPFFLLAFTTTLIVLAYTLWANQERWLLIIGYGYRFIILFAIMLIVAVLRSITSPRSDRWIILSVFTVFVVNTVVVMDQRLHGETAIYVNSFTGARIEMYGAGLLGEPNPLSAGLFFVFILVMLGMLVKSKALRVSLYLPCALACLVALAFIANRSAMIGAAVVLIASLLSASMTRIGKTLALGLLFGVGVVATIALHESVRLVFYSLSTALNVRTELWTLSWDKFLGSPLTGWGIGLWSEPHQAYLRILGEFGIVGAVSLLALFGAILFINPRWTPTASQVSCSRKEASIDWLWSFKVYLLALLVTGFSTDSLTPVLSWQLLAYVGGLAWGEWASRRYFLSVRKSSNHCRAQGTQPRLVGRS